MNDFCDECYEQVEGEKLQHCKSLNHSINKVLGNTEHDELKKDEKKIKSGKICLVSKEKKKFEYEILDEPFTTLRPITLLENKTRMILVYLPTKIQQVDDEESEIKFSYQAFFVTAKEGIVSPKSIIPLEAEEIKKNYKTSVMNNFYQGRWDSKQVFSWLESEDKINIKESFDLMMNCSKYYLDFDNEYDYAYFVLWNFHTYVYELFDSTPYNDYTGTKRAGKSKAMEFQKLVCFNAIMSADMSGSSLFRIIEGLGSTILLDETEQFKNKKNDSMQHVRTLLMQGFLKDQYAVRSESRSDGGYTPTTFNLYSPKSLAHITELDDVLEDRCIQQLMRRTTNKDKLNSWPDEKRDSRFKDIRNACYRIFLDYGNEIYDLQIEAQKLLKVSGRELKIWNPIITLALFFERHGVSGLVNLIQEKSNESSEERQIQDEEDSFDLRILRFITNYGVSVTEEKNGKSNPKGWKATQQLHTKLIDLKLEFSINEDFMTNHKFTSILKRLGFKKAKKVLGISWLIDEDSIKDANDRMNPTSVSSSSSSSSVSSVTSSHKTEHNEHNEHNDGTLEKYTITPKTEHNEHNEHDEIITSSSSSFSSANQNEEKS